MSTGPSLATAPVHALVQIRLIVRQSDPPADNVEHNLHYAWIQAGPVGNNNFQNLADGVALAFKQGYGGTPAFFMYGGRDITVKTYNAADTKPRLPIGENHTPPSTWETSPLGPRATALCLSFYSVKNIPHQRGRIYIGPFINSEQLERPITSVVNRQIDLARALYHVDPPNWQWSTFSTVTQTLNPVTQAWTNDIWDGQSRRDPKESYRDTSPVP